MAQLSIEKIKEASRIDLFMDAEKEIRTLYTKLTSFTDDWMKVCQSNNADTWKDIFSDVVAEDFIDKINRGAKQLLTKWTHTVLRNLYPSARNLNVRPDMPNNILHLPEYSDFYACVVKEVTDELKKHPSLEDDTFQAIKRELTYRRNQPQDTKNLIFCCSAFEKRGNSIPVKYHTKPHSAQEFMVHLLNYLSIVIHEMQPSQIMKTTKEINVISAVYDLEIDGYDTEKCRQSAKKKYDIGSGITVQYLLGGNAVVRFADKEKADKARKPFLDNSEDYLAELNKNKFQREYGAPL